MPKRLWCCQPGWRSGYSCYTLSAGFGQQVVQSLAIMQLVEDGKINLNDPVQKYLPWFDVKGEGRPKITVAHLVYQTSGFSEYDGNEINMLPDSPGGREESVCALSNVKLTFKPGEGWE